MALVNQAVADEVATLVARHRYSVDDSRDVVKGAEQAASKNNEAIKEAAAQRQQEISERVDEAKAAAEKPRNEWGSQPRAETGSEIDLGGEDEEYEAAAPSRQHELSQPAAQSPSPQPSPSQQPSPQQPSPQQPSPQPQAAPPPAAPKPAPRRPAFDEDDDFENDSWLR
ncbi:hypothetical protein [Parasphingorhabdus pacifica]